MSGEMKRRHYDCKCEGPNSQVPDWRHRGHRDSLVGGVLTLEKAIVMRKVRMERHVANAKNTESFRRRAGSCCALAKVGRSRVVPRNELIVESEANIFIRVGPRVRPVAT